MQWFGLGLVGGLISFSASVLVTWFFNHRITFSDTGMPAASRV